MQLYAILPPPILQLIASHTDPQSMALLMQTNHTMHSQLRESEIAWFTIGERICGSNYWRDGYQRWMAVPLESSSSSFPTRSKPLESASAFTRRMLCPWLQPPQLLDLFPAEVSTAVDSKQTCVWRITLVSNSAQKDEEQEEYAEENRGESRTYLSVDAQSLTAESGFGYWFGDDSGGNINTRYCIPAHPFDESKYASQTTATTTTPRPAQQTVDPAMQLLVDQTVFTANADDESPLVHSSMRSGEGHANCWHLHAGVVAGRYADPHADSAGLGFFSVRTRKRHPHFLRIREEMDYPSDEIVQARPGELWLLERWHEPRSRVLYYGPAVQQ